MAEKPAKKKDGFYQKYMRVMGRVGDIQGRGILIILYFTVFLIPGAALAAFGDRLQIKRKPTAWSDRADQENTLEGARDQW
jgi:hypothetical protein